MPSSDKSSCYEGAAKGHYRIVIMGAAAVGKTALVHRFLYDAFPHTHVPTVEELHRGEFSSGGKGAPRLVLDVLDTAGSYEFPAMRRLALATGDAFVLVYAVDDVHSFDEVSRLRELVLSAKGGEGAVVVVVGHKSDLAGSGRVRRELADTLVTLDWEARFVEASAKDNHNVLEVFRAVLEQARCPHRLDPAQHQRRRISLPLHYAPPPPKTKRTPHSRAKRNSCAVS